MKIAFIGTGGTFSNEGKGPLDYLDYLDTGRVLPTSAVLDLMPEVSHLATVTPVGFSQLRSKAIGPVQWEELVATVTAQVQDPNIDGVIITHGTGVLEETAYYLHLRLNTTKPVVVLGAQRPPTTVGSDAQKNFVDALYWIRNQHRTQQSMGVVTVMNQLVHSARDVVKLSNHTLQALQSPHAGPIARVNVDGSISHYRYPHTCHTHSSELTGEILDPQQVRVDIIHQYAGADATALDACVAAGAQGLVVVGFPPGTNTPAVDEAIERYAARGVVIVQASRAIDDPQVMPRDGLRHVVKNSDLSPPHARILLLLSLHHGLSVEEIQHIFTTH